MHTCPRRTYSTLISKGRLAQLVAWVGGPSFDGPIVLDECHKGAALPLSWRVAGCMGSACCLAHYRACMGGVRGHLGHNPCLHFPFCCLSAAKNHVPGKEKQSTKVGNAWHEG